jgi:hypothetical protein
VTDKYGCYNAEPVGHYYVKQREWVGLTEEEIVSFADWPATTWSKWLKFARAIEANLKEKNNADRVE